MQSTIRRLGWRTAAREAWCQAINAARLAWNRDLLGIRFYERRVHEYRLVIDLHDAGISRQLMRRGTREEEHLFMLDRTLRPGAVVLDLGANIGYYSAMMARRIGPTGHVYAAEPDAANYHLLNVNLRLNGVEDIVETFNVAIGRESGTGRFFLSAMSNCHTLCPEGIADEIAAGGTRCVDVPVVGIMDLLRGRRHVDLLRMDIEGYEVEVLEGLLADLAHAPTALLFETHRAAYHDGRRMATVLQTLFDNGYAARWIAADWHVERDARGAYERLGYRDHLVEVFPVADRAIYRDIRPADAIRLVTETDNVRAILLQRLP